MFLENPSYYSTLEAKIKTESNMLIEDFKRILGFDSIIYYDMIQASTKLLERIGEKTFKFNNTTVNILNETEAQIIIRNNDDYNVTLTYTYSVDNFPSISVCENNKTTKTLRRIFAGDKLISEKSYDLIIYSLKDFIPSLLYHIYLKYKNR